MSIETVYEMPFDAPPVYDNGGAEFNIKHRRFAGGAKGDGVTDDTAAFEAVIAAALSAPGGRALVPPGTYKTTSNIVAEITGTTPRHLTITGVPGASVIKPSSAVTTCLTIAGDVNTDGSTNRVHLEGLRIDGVDTTGAVGILAGDNAANLSGYLSMRNVEVFRFAGSGGKGLHAKDVVGLFAQNCYLGRSATNLYIEGSDPALPTVLLFKFCQFREATTKGVNILQGYGMRFKDCVFESNGEEGAYLDPAAGETILKAVFEDCWFESNYLGHASRTSNYSFKAVGTGATCQPHLIRCYFSGGTGVEKDASFEACTNIILDNPFVNNNAGLIAVDANCTGHVVNWDEGAAAMLSVISNASANLHGITNSGQAVVANGTTSIAVTHGLGVTPPIVKIRVLPQDNMGNATHYWISAVGGTTFTINVDQDPGASGAAFNWEITL